MLEFNNQLKYMVYIVSKELNQALLVKVNAW